MPAMQQPRTPTDLERWRQRNDELDALIAETKQGLPAHSVKPQQMMALLALEDERDTLLAFLNKKR